MFTARLLSRIGDHLAKVAIAIPSAVAFVAAVPAPLRARAFGVAQSGLAIIQGVGLIVVGLAAEHVAVLQVVAASGALGTIGVCVVAAFRPRQPTAATDGGVRRQRSGVRR